MSERRTKAHNIASQGTLPGIDADGVGGRHTPPSMPGPGGGYLDGRSPQNFAIPHEGSENFGDPRLLELKAIGLRPVWLAVAKLIGVDNFLPAWQLLDQDPAHTLDSPSQLRMTLPTFRQYRRFQRNVLVRQLLDAGLTPEEVVDRVEKCLREKLTKKHVARLGRRR